MSFPVIKGAAYDLIHCPSLLIDYGTTQSVEREKNPESEFLRKLPEHLRSFDQVVAYAPNQTFIGNLDPAELAGLARPWHEHPVAGAERFGRYGEIMPEAEFYCLLKVVDAFDLVFLEEGFVSRMLPVLAEHPLFTEADQQKIGAGQPQAEIDSLLAEPHMAVPLKLNGQLVGCVRRAHEVDENLSAHVMLENLVVKASGTLALRTLLQQKDNAGPEAVEYIIECSEEACGDMNQRGGGNFAKSIAEMAGCVNATGSDTRGFCAAPAHALLEAAALVQSGVFRNVVVVAGGAIAKLGMNAKDHVNKGLPVLEDVIGAFAVQVAADDGVSPRIRTDVVGRHRVGSGAAPQAVMQAIVTEPLDRVGWKVTDIDKYSPEMQNPDITEPAGAGDVPKANLKMIAALGVKRGEVARDQIENFVLEHGVPGFAPTQGHIPSGVPLIGFARDAILEGKMNRVMIIGKGSLFLGRMTNLFDGVSFVLDKNPGRSTAAEVRELTRTRVGVTIFDSEHGPAEVVRGAQIAQRNRQDLEIVLIGDYECELPSIPASNSLQAHQAMEQALTDGKLDAVVTMHYPFPVGVTTIGRVITPARGREMLLASTTGTSSQAGRAAGMVYNAIYGQAVAKALGITSPSLGLLNLDNAPQAERVLRQMVDRGYDLRFASSLRADGGALMRGNDLLAGVCDIMVTDTLTGNVLMKLFSAFNTGGDYEAVGYGYGPSAGEGYRRIINIVSRASGAPVIANALEFAGDMAKGGLPDLVAAEIAAAKRAGLEELLAAVAAGPKGGSTQTGSGGADIPAAPPVKVTDEELHGVDILALEDAVHELWRNGIYAASGMGCTGPVVMIAAEDHDRAVEVLKKANYL